MTEAKVLLLITFITFVVFLCLTLWDLFHHDSANEILGRTLYDSDGTLYLVDSDGNEYEPYATAWRYLGMFIDCGGNNNNYGSCYRRVSGHAVIWQQ